MSAHETLARGTVIDGRFRIVRLLASGGMGDVYVAEQLSLARTVALKVLSGEAQLAPGAMARFRREAQLLSRVDHPSVVRVIDFGQTAGAAFLVMDLVDGESLEERLTQVGAFPTQAALSLLRHVAEGLAAIHARGIVHGDLKPGNVVLSGTLHGDRARLLDFGIARLLDPQDASASEAGSSAALGTPPYMSPEQALGQMPDARSDVYGFGVLAYRMFCGRLPHPGPSAREFLAQHVEAAPTPLRELAPSVPESIAAAVMRCLAKDPAHRPADGAALCRELATVRLPSDAASSAAGETPTPLFGAHVEAARRERATLVLVVSPSPEGAPSAVEDLEGRASTLLRDFRGRIASRGPDRVLAAFRSPTDAVRAAMSLRDGLSHPEAAAPTSAALPARIALHAGEVIFTQGTITGAAVTLVAAVAARAEPGEVILTEAVRLSMNRAGVTLEPRAPLAIPDGGALPLYRCARADERISTGGARLSGRRPAAGALGVWRGTAAPLLGRIAVTLASAGRGAWRRARAAAQRLKRPL